MTFLTSIGMQNGLLSLAGMFMVKFLATNKEATDIFLFFNSFSVIA